MSASAAAREGGLSPLPPSGNSPLPLGRHRLTIPGRPDNLLVLPPTTASAPRPLLVFCHGAGGTPEDAAQLVGAAAVAADVALLLPACAGSTWDLVLGAPGPDVAALDAGLQFAARAAAIDPHRVAIGGFSDGASYALSLGLANGELFAAVLAFSPGFVMAPRRRGRLRCFVSHGTADTVLPVRCGRRAVATLRRDGYDVVYEEFNGGHLLPPSVAAAALRWWLQPPSV